MGDDAGSGNDWPIPYTGANSSWVIHSDIGDLARIFTDSNGNGIYIETPCKFAACRAYDSIIQQ